VWFEEAPRLHGAAVALGWAPPFQACPPLPGVWELRGQVERELMK
jgi:hypothetical protein